MPLPVARCFPPFARRPTGTYRLTVVADGCLDADEEVHRVLVDKVFPCQAEVVSVDEWAGRPGTG